MTSLKFGPKWMRRNAGTAHDSNVSKISPKVPATNSGNPPPPFTTEANGTHPQATQGQQTSYSSVVALASSGQANAYELGNGLTRDAMNPFKYSRDYILSLYRPCALPIDFEEVEHVTSEESLTPVAYVPLSDQEKQLLSLSTANPDHHPQSAREPDTNKIPVPKTARPEGNERRDRNVDFERRRRTEASRPQQGDTSGNDGKPFRRHDRNADFSQIGLRRGVHDQSGARSGHSSNARDPKVSPAEAAEEGRSRPVELNKPVDVVDVAADLVKAAGATELPETRESSDPAPTGSRIVSILEAAADASHAAGLADHPRHATPLSQSTISPLEALGHQSPLPPVEAASFRSSSRHQRFSSSGPGDSRGAKLELKDEILRNSINDKAGDDFARDTNTAGQGISGTRDHERAHLRNATGDSTCDGLKIAGDPRKRFLAGTFPRIREGSSVGDQRSEFFPGGQSLDPELLGTTATSWQNGVMGILPGPGSYVDSNIAISDDAADPASVAGTSRRVDITFLANLAPSPSINSTSSVVSLLHPDVHKVYAFAMEWFYKDPRGDIHGPFPNNQMHRWFILGYFTMDLFMRPMFQTVEGEKLDHGVFETLEEIIKNHCQGNRRMPFFVCLRKIADFRDPIDPGQVPPQLFASQTGGNLDQRATFLGGSPARGLTVPVSDGLGGHPVVTDMRDHRLHGRKPMVPHQSVFDPFQTQPTPMGAGFGQELSQSPNERRPLSAFWGNGGPRTTFDLPQNVALSSPTTTDPLISSLPQNPAGTPSPRDKGFRGNVSKWQDPNAGGEWSGGTDPEHNNLLQSLMASVREAPNPKQGVLDGDFAGNPTPFDRSNVIEVNQALANAPQQMPPFIGESMPRRSIVQDQQPRTLATVEEPAVVGSQTSLRQLAVSQSAPPQDMRPFPGNLSIPQANLGLDGQVPTSVEDVFRVNYPHFPASGETATPVSCESHTHRRSRVRSGRLAGEELSANEEPPAPQSALPSPPPSTTAEPRGPEKGIQSPETRAKGEVAAREGKPKPTEVETVAKENEIPESNEPKAPRGAAPKTRRAKTLELGGHDISATDESHSQTTADVKAPWMSAGVDPSPPSLMEIIAAEESKQPPDTQATKAQVVTKASTPGPTKEKPGKRRVRGEPLPLSSSTSKPKPPATQPSRPWGLATSSVDSPVKSLAEIQREEEEQEHARRSASKTAAASASKNGKGAPVKRYADTVGGSSSTSVASLSGGKFQGGWNAVAKPPTSAQALHGISTVPKSGIVPQSIHSKPTTPKGQRCGPRPPTARSSASGSPALQANAAPRAAAQTGKQEMLTSDGNVKASSGSPEFRAWCKSALSKFPKGVDVDSFIDVLMEFAVDNGSVQTTVGNIHELVLSVSTVVDSRKFADEFVQRRRKELSLGTESNEESQFTFVKGKKGGKKR